LKVGTLQFIKKWCEDFFPFELIQNVKLIREKLVNALNRIWEDALVLTTMDKQMLLNIGETLSKFEVHTKDPEITPMGDENTWIKRSMTKIFQAESKASFPADYEIFLMESSNFIAEQLTIIECQLFKRISWTDLLYPDISQNERDSLHNFVDHFNNMTCWLGRTLLETEKINLQASKLSKMIKIGQKCCEMGNLSTAMQICLALQTIQANLKEIWVRVPTTLQVQYESLRSLTTPLRNFHALRTVMESDKNFQCIPFVGLYTADIKTILETPNDYGRHLIPWARYRQIATLIKKFKQYQLDCKKLRRNDSLIDFLHKAVNRNSIKFVT